VSVLGWFAAIIVLLALTVCGYLYFFREYEVRKIAPQGDVRLLKNALREEVRVTDAESGQTIFIYRDGDGVALETVEKKPDGEWVVVFHDSNRSNK